MPRLRSTHTHVKIFQFVTLAVFISISIISAAGQDGTVVVANMTDNTATIIDVGSKTALATLPTGVAPHEIAVAADGGTAVITNYGNRSAPGNSLTVIDVRTLTVSRTIDLGVYQRPHGIAYLPGDSLVAVTSESSSAVILVDVRSGDVVKEIPTTQRTSHMLAASGSGDVVFTTNIVDGTVSVIDPTADAPEKIIAVAPIVEGIAASPDGKTLWVGSNKQKTVSVVDVNSGVVTDSLTGFGFPYRMAITPDGKLVVLSDPMLGEIRVVRSDTRKEAARITVPSENVVAGAEFPNSPAPEGIAISRDASIAFVSLQGRNEVAFVDLANGSIVAFVSTGVWPDGIGYSPLTR